MQRVSGEIRATTAGNDCFDSRSKRRCCPQRGRASGAGTEVSQVETADAWVISHFLRDSNQASCQQTNVEPEMTCVSLESLLIFREQIEQQRATPDARSTPATARLRRLKRLLPLPCANKTKPTAFGGISRSPERVTSPQGIRSAQDFDSAANFSLGLQLRTSFVIRSFTFINSAFLKPVNIRTGTRAPRILLRTAQILSPCRLLLPRRRESPIDPNIIGARFERRFAKSEKPDAVRCCIIQSMKTTAKGTISKIALVFLVAFPAWQTIRSSELPKLTTSEKMAWSTYAVATAKGLGTGVIVNREDPTAPGGIVPVLVTCTHVLAAAPRGPYFLVLRMPVQNANPAIAMLRIDVPPDSQHPFVAHPRRDIAAMEIRLPPDVAHIISIPSFISENTLARQSAPHVGDQILVLGFPKVFPGTEGGFPIFRTGTIASSRAVHRRIWKNI